MLVGVSNGLSSNELQNLKYADFINGYDSKTQVTTFDLRRGKTGVDFYTFLNPEATKAVLDYLDFRTRSTKTRARRRETQLEEQRVTEDRYLFILQNVPDSYLETGNEEERKLESGSI